ncbi:hypothetical protein BDZ89DRAFT_1056757 [Hymenopellis radicata]|nr:hypothetical protein BDZ89DRAFT_1056757 [Hymenopellis radicata]
MSSSLPQELVDRIIDLNADHVIALHASALVSRSWTPRAQRHLFRTIAVAFYKPRTLVNLASVFRASSFLASHVQTVILTGNMDASKSRPPFPLDSFKSVLDNIRAAAQEVSFMDIAYSSLLQTVQNHLLAFLSTPSIKSLALDGAVFNFQSSMNIITLHRTSLWVPPSPFPQSTRTIPLENLEFRGYFLVSFTDFLREPHCPLSIRRLRSLRLSGPYFIKELNELFPRIAALNQLTINFPSYIPSDVLELNLCPQLQSLTFMVDHHLLTEVETFFDTVFSAEYRSDSLNIVSFSFGPKAIHLKKDKKYWEHIINHLESVFEERRQPWRKSSWTENSRWTVTLQRVDV